MGSVMSITNTASISSVVKVQKMYSLVFFPCINKKRQAEEHNPLLVLQTQIHWS